MPPYHFSSILVERPMQRRFLLCSNGKSEGKQLSNVTLSFFVYLFIHPFPTTQTLSGYSIWLQPKKLASLPGCPTTLKLPTEMKSNTSEYRYMIRPQVISCNMQMRLRTSSPMVCIMEVCWFIVKGGFRGVQLLWLCSWCGKAMCMHVLQSSLSLSLAYTKHLRIYVYSLIPCTQTQWYMIQYFLIGKQIWQWSNHCIYASAVDL